MKPCLIFIGWLIATASMSAALPDDPVQPTYRLLPTNLETDWAELLAKLRSAPPLRADFEERRFFHFRRGFTQLIGQIRLHPEHGLSLHYLKPEEYLMVVDASGAFMQHERDKRREMPDSNRARAATRALLHVLRFDLEQLAENFEIYAARDAADWIFVFVPKPDGELSGVLHPIAVTGHDAEVRLIEMRKSDRQRVEIHINNLRTGVIFSPEDMARYFR